MGYELHSDHPLSKDHTANDGQAATYLGGQYYRSVSFDAQHTLNCTAPNLKVDTQHNMDFGKPQRVESMGNIALPSRICRNKRIRSDGFQANITFDSSLSNSHLYSPLGFGANDFSKSASFCRRQDTNTNVEQGIIKGVSFCSSEQGYYNERYPSHPENVHKYHHYQNFAAPQYNNGLYHSQSFNSISSQIQHIPCHQQPPREVTGAFGRPFNHDLSNRRMENNFVWNPNYHRHPAQPQHLQFSPSSTNYTNGDYNNNRSPFNYQDTKDDFCHEHPVIEMPRKRKHVDAACRHDMDYTIICADRSMSPVSDLSISPAPSMEDDDLEQIHTKMPNNEQLRQPFPSQITEKNLQHYQNPANVYNWRVPFRPVTPMKTNGHLPSEGESGEQALSRVNMFNDNSIWIGNNVSHSCLEQQDNYEGWNQ